MPSVASSGRRRLRPWLAAIVFWAGVGECCTRVKVQSDLFPFVSDEYVLSSYVPSDEGGPVFQFNQRPIYESASDGPTRYLYHIQIGEDMGGRWLIGGDVGLNSAWAFVQSWAVAPHLIPLVSDRAVWRVYRADEDEESVDPEESPWLEDKSFTVECLGEDTSIFVMSGVGQSLGGFFVETAQTQLERPVLVNPSGLYMYATPQVQGGILWIVGEDAGSVQGLAYASSEVLHPADMADEPWHVAVESVWTHDTQFQIVSSDKQRCVESWLELTGSTSSKSNDTGAATAACAAAGTTWQVVRLLRGARKPRSNTVELANGVRVPLVGFGTGAMAPEEVEGALTGALQAGYKLIDTASAYANEEIIGEVLGRPGAVPRSEVVLVSKLWYSELGFDQTMAAAQRSLARLGTDYLDAYLIHWPRCYPEVSWMDCSEASKGTWQQSWRALERLYCEGQALGIGVSNFDQDLLQELLDLSSSSPSLLQNFADPLHTDLPLIQLAQDNGIFFMSYSSLRPFVLANEDDKQYRGVKKLAGQIAVAHNATAAQVILRWLTQLHVGVIPRSKSAEHLSQNLNLWKFRLSEDEMRLMSAQQDAATAARDEL